MRIKYNTIVSYTLVLASRSRDQQQYGMTLVEILVVFAVLGVLFSSSAFAFKSIQQRTELRNASASVVHALELAHNRAATGFGTASQGVHFEEDKVILFSGGSYVSGNGEETVLSPFISVSPAGVDVVFSRISAIPNASTVITVSNSAGDSSSISVSPEGLISSGE